MTNSNCAVTTQRSESTSAQNQSSKEPKEAKVDHMQILQTMMRQHDQQIDIINQSKIKIQEELSALKLKHQNLQDETDSIVRDHKKQMQKLMEDHDDKIEEYAKEMKKMKYDYEERLR